MTSEASQQGEIKKKRPGRWKKGESGNPGGRPKSGSLRELIQEYFKEKEGDRTNLQVVLDNLKKYKPEILLYFVYGKPAETLNMAGSIEVTGLPADVLSTLREIHNQHAIEAGKVLMVGYGTNG